MNITYISSVLIGAPKGPSVNEFEFLFDVDSKGYLRSCLYPATSNITFNADEDYSFSTTGNRILDELLVLIKAIYFIVKAEKIEILVLRFTGFYLIWPVIIYLTKLVHPQARIHIKSIGVGYYRAAKERRFSLLYFCLKYSLHKVSSFDCPSIDALNRFVLEFPEVERSGIVIKNGVSDRFFESFNPNKVLDEPIFLGYIGRQPCHRGALEAIEVCAHLKESGIDTRVVITGSEQEVAYAKDLAFKLDVSGNVEFVGLIDANSVPETMNKLDFGFSIIKNIEGTSAQKLRQYCALGVIPVHFGYGFFDSHLNTSSIKFEDPSTTANMIKSIIVAKSYAKLSCDLHEWALVNLSYSLDNNKRVKFMSGGYEHSR